MRTPKPTTYMLRIYSLLAVAGLTTFGVAHILDNTHAMLGILEVTASVVLFIQVVTPGFARRMTLVKNTLLGMILLFFGITLVTGGTFGAGILWLYTFPVAAFFLTGQREGIWWMAALFMVLGVMGASAALGYTIPYSMSTLVHLTGSLLVVAIGMYVYQQTREHLFTQNQESQAELTTEKIRADSIVQSLSEGVVVTDATGYITFINDSAQQLLGWKKSALLGKNFTAAVPMVPARTAPTVLTQTATQQRQPTTQPVTERVIFRRKDNTLAPVLLTRTPLTVSSTKNGCIYTLHDSRAEEDIVRAKSEFVTIASHQLRTPISAVSWVSELLLNGDAGALTPEQRTHVEDIYKSNQRMAALVGEMLIVSSLELQSMPITPQKVDLTKIAKSIIKEQAFADARKNHTLHEHYGTNLPELKCDPEVMRLILRNLLSNAFKYTPSGGEISLAITVDTTKKITAESAGSIVVTITDTGYGIPEQAQQKIFSKFFRAENILHADTDGTGLGLYVVKALLDYVGGYVTFTSHEGKGTTFSVALPLEGMTKQQISTRVPQQIKQGAVHV